MTDHVGSRYRTRSRGPTARTTSSGWLALPQKWPLFIAHRGDVSAAPQNTIPAFEAPRGAGADGIELDVRLTQDRKLVVLHDRALDRTTNGKGLVDHHTLDEIKVLDAGSWFSPSFTGEPPSTLERVFEAMPPDFLINVEIKVVLKEMRLIAESVADAVRRHRRWESTLVASFNPMALYHLRGFDPDIVRGYIWSRRHPYPVRCGWLRSLASADWYDPAPDTYDRDAHREYRRAGHRILV
jgi:glycerophosphoryl diester phosphodiesterase